MHSRREKSKTGALRWWFPPIRRHMRSNGRRRRGFRLHEAALAKGVKVTGATVHFVSEVVDGGAIIAQKAVQVEDGDTPERLQKRVMAEAEWLLLPQAVSDFCAGRLSVQGTWVARK